jgi:hypothetical protein
MFPCFDRSSLQTNRFSESFLLVFTIRPYGCLHLIPSLRVLPRLCRTLFAASIRVLEMCHFAAFCRKISGAFFGCPGRLVRPYVPMGLALFWPSTCVLSVCPPISNASIPPSVSLRPHLRCRGPIFGQMAFLFWPSQPHGWLQQKAAWLNAIQAVFPSNCSIFFSVVPAASASVSFCFGVSKKNLFVSDSRLAPRTRQWQLCGHLLQRRPAVSQRRAGEVQRRRVHPSDPLQFSK